MSKDPLTTLEADSITLKFVDTKWRRHTHTRNRKDTPTLCVRVCDWIIGEHANDAYYRRLADVPVSLAQGKRHSSRPST